MITLQPIFTPRSLARIIFSCQVERTLHSSGYIHFIRLSHHCILLSFMGCYLCVQFRSRLASPNLNEHQSWSKAECTATFTWLAFLFAWQSKWTTIADLRHKFKVYTLYQVDELSIFKKSGLLFVSVWKHMECFYTTVCTLQLCPFQCNFLCSTW